MHTMNVEQCDTRAKERGSGDLDAAARDVEDVGQEILHAARIAATTTYEKPSIE